MEGEVAKADAAQQEAPRRGPPLQDTPAPPIIHRPPYAHRCHPEKFLRDFEGPDYLVSKNFWTLKHALFWAHASRSRSIGPCRTASAACASLHETYAACRRDIKSGA
jgi:hypothetical protein